MSQIAQKLKCFYFSSLIPGVQLNLNISSQISVNINPHFLAGHNMLKNTDLHPPTSAPVIFINWSIWTSVLNLKWLPEAAAVWPQRKKNTHYLSSFVNHTFQQFTYAWLAYNPPSRKSLAVTETWLNPGSTLGCSLCQQLCRVTTCVRSWEVSLAAVVDDICKPCTPDLLQWAHATQFCSTLKALKVVRIFP